MYSVHCLAQQVMQLWHSEHVGQVVPSGEYVRNIFFGSDEYANKASQWLVSLYSRSRSACAAAGRTCCPTTYRPMTYTYIIIHLTMNDATDD